MLSVGLLRWKIWLLWRYGSCSEELSEFGDRSGGSPFGHTFVPNEGVHCDAVVEKLIEFYRANLFAVFGDVIFHNLQNIDVILVQFGTKLQKN